MGIVLGPLILLFLIISVISLIITVRTIFSKSSPKISTEEMLGLFASLVVIPIFAIFLQIYDYVDVDIFLKDRVCVHNLKLLSVYTFTISPLFLGIALVGYINKKVNGVTRHQAFFLGFLNSAFIYPLVIMFFGTAFISFSSFMFYNGKVVSCFTP